MATTARSVAASAAAVVARALLWRSWRPIGSCGSSTAWTSGARPLRPSCCAGRCRTRGCSCSASPLTATY
eukprot:415896-Prymnesium_polylepis.1